MMENSLESILNDLKKAKENVFLELKKQKKMSQLQFGKHILHFVIQ